MAGTKITTESFLYIYIQSLLNLDVKALFKQEGLCLICVLYRCIIFYEETKAFGVKQITHFLPPLPPLLSSPVVFSPMISPIALVNRPKVVFKLPSTVYKLADGFFSGFPALAPIYVRYWL